MGVLDPGVRSRPSPRIAKFGVCRRIAFPAGFGLVVTISIDSASSRASR